LGQEFAREVAQAVAHITISPAAFPQVHDAIRRLLMRRFPYGIFYRDTAAEIVILGVTHLRREPQRWQRRS
jgi:plasmid stabilization system protein ParE